MKRGVVSSEYWYIAAGHNYTAAKHVLNGNFIFRTSAKLAPIKCVTSVRPYTVKVDSVLMRAERAAFCSH